MKRTETDLQTIRFGESEADTFYCLVDRRRAPDGLDPESMKLVDPRSFDTELREMGCLVMLTGEEVKELVARGELNRDNLHESLYELARREGLLTRE